MRRLGSVSLSLLAIFAACSDTADPIGQLEPKLKIEPETLDFGRVQIGTEQELTIALKNIGNGLLTLSSVGEGEPWDEAFTVSVDRLDIPASSQALVRITFKPQRLGEVTSKVSVKSKIPDKVPNTEILIRGVGASAELTIDPQALSFGNVVVLTSKTLPVTVTNSSDIPAEVRFAPASNVTFCGAQGADAATFCLAPTTKPLNAESEFALAANESARFDITFRPTVAGTRERGEFTFQACSACPLQRVTLDGVGIDQGFRCMPPDLDFGLVNPMSCLTKTVSCENVANEQVSIVDWGLGQGAGSSPDFTVEDFGAVAVLAEGDTIDVDVTYCPTDLGNDSGLLAIETDNTDPRRKFVTVQLSGNGGGPDIDVAPIVLNFGQVSLIAPARRTLSIANLGFAPLEITEILADLAGTGAFSTMNTGQRVDVGSFYDVTVEFQPQVEGPIMSELVIRSNDQDEREVHVQLIGEGVNLPPCTFEVVPASLGFGVVERGRVASRAFEVRNQGSSDCLVTGVRMVPGSDTEFSLPDGDVMSLRIAPNAAATFRVQYAPAMAGSDTGGVEFSISSLTSPFNTVSLAGTGADAVLLITPNDLDFGTIGIGCAARSRVVTIYNTGATAARINSIALAAPGNPAFTVSNLPSPLPASPLNLPPGGAASFEVGFRADTQSSYAAAVEINGQVNGQPVTYIVALQGRGANDARQIDEFDQLGRPKVDILFVIDNSCSMFEEQTGLASNLGAFMQFAQAQQIDFNVAATTTDVEGGEDGRFVPVSGAATARIITPATQPSPEAVFGQNVALGTNGSGNEQGLQAAYLALSNPLIFGHNAGFLRQDAVLSIIFVSDEQDYSSGAIDFFVNFFLSIKGFRNTNLFSASSIVGDSPGGCNGPGGNADDGSRYVEVANRTGGVFQSICISDWSRALEDLSTTAFGFKSRFFLSNQPVITSLRVFVDDVEISARASGGTVNWEYDYPTNSINFTPFATPEPGAHIRAEYVVECL
jgi:hypothetical protein